MERTFDDDLVSADAVHLVVDPVAALVEIAFHLEGRELIGHDAHPPATLVGPCIAVAIGDDFMGRLVFLAFAEGTVAAFAGLRFRLRRDRPFRPLRGNDLPPTDNGILSQFRHRQAPKVVDKKLFQFPH